MNVIYFYLGQDFKKENPLVLSLIFSVIASLLQEDFKIYVYVCVHMCTYAT